MEDILEFANSIQEWHSRKVSNLNDVIEQVKEGIVIKNGTDGEEVALNRNQAACFKAGLLAALGEFEKLPFTLEKNESPDDENDDDN